MNARIAKDEVSILFPTNASYSSPVQNAEREVSQAREAEMGRKFDGFGRAILRSLAWIGELPRRRAVLSELQTMSDRELSDIGLSRSELPLIFDTEFAAARNSARAKAAPVKLAQAS